jgi:23S rRNA pseudouridine2605 synthase
VAFDGRRTAGEPTKKVVYAVNKPKGVVSTSSDPQRRRTVVELVRTDARLYPVGRLDIDTTGLILLTNDGELANRLTHPRFEVAKTYVVRLKGPPVADRSIRRLRDGLELEDGRTAPARVRRLTPHTLEITIREGRKRQIRRMCEAVGYRVAELQRTRIGPLELGSLKEGDVRELTSAEVAALKRGPRA